MTGAPAHLQGLRRLHYLEYGICLFSRLSENRQMTDESRLWTHGRDRGKGGATKTGRPEDIGRFAATERGACDT